MDKKKQEKSNAKYRNWCGTWFYNEREFAEDHFSGLFDSGAYDYAICGFEICPTTGREHGQWFIKFKSQRYFGGVKRLFPPEVHIEACAGSLQDNVHYCSKDKDFREWGTYAAKSKDEFYKNTKRELTNGNSLGSLVHRATSVSQIKQIEYMSKYFTPDKIPPYVTWIWGKAGSGKTRLAMSRDGTKYIKEPGNKWFEGYGGEDIVIFDDCRPHIDEWPKFNVLLRLLDRYPIRVEFKNGSTFFNPKQIIITSIFSPEQCVPGNEDADQLLRRIHEIVAM